MTSTLALAARLRAMGDDALVAALAGRGVATTGIRDFFDLADALLEPDSLQACLSRLDRHAIAGLAALGERAASGGGRMSGSQAKAALGLDAPAVERLHEQLLLDFDDGGIAGWAEVAGQLARWPSLGLPDPRDDAPPPEHPAVAAPDRASTDHLAAEHAFAAMTATAELLFELEREPARLLARGALGQPETRRLAHAMAIEEPAVATLVAAAESAGLVRREGARLLVAEGSPPWLNLSASRRWVALAETWAISLPGDIRSRLAEHPDILWGQGLRDWLAWLYPAGGAWLAGRVSARLEEAERLGITAGEVVSTPGAALLSGETARAEELLAKSLPDPVDKVYLQHDLSAVAPGPLEPGIDARLRSMAEVDGRAIASRFRFSAASLGRAIAAGETAGSLLEFLEEVSLTGVPQPLGYLIGETAARHGLLRVGALPSGDPEAVSYVRSEDSALLGAVRVDRSLAALSLAANDTHRLVSRRDRSQVYWALVDARYPVAAEDSRGRIVQVRRPVSARVSAPAPVDPVRQLVERLRLADAGAPLDPGQAWLYRQLEEAIRSKATVTVSVRMPNDTVVDYRLEPASVAGGRLRARDPLSEIERTLPLSSIAAVSPT
ncbi:hypothetical protein GCM10022239_08350 [Leifsonia bigeumensis]|uniref:Helicase XPB/Ssl2 N-terminal domain-containing protein n=1 Tax=Leifsonella bigeumensis TaxID=433643 RepID=A0ABP7FFH7_9MICO